VIDPLSVATDRLVKLRLDQSEFDRPAVVRLDDNDHRRIFQQLSADT